MLLEINDINKSFGGLLALQDISFSVEEGETLGIMGANGAGKTTLFSLIFIFIYIFKTKNIYIFIREWR